MICKFCGKEFSTETFTAPAPGSRSCGECARYCMTKCEHHKRGLLSWYDEPCKGCFENPYNKYLGGSLREKQ